MSPSHELISRCGILFAGLHSFPPRGEPRPKRLGAIVWVLWTDVYEVLESEEIVARPRLDARRSHGASAIWLEFPLDRT
jgi:hypothetical protein